MLLNPFLQVGKLRQNPLWLESLWCPRDSAAKGVSTFFPQEAVALARLLRAGVKGAAASWDSPRSVMFLEVWGGEWEVLCRTAAG